MGPVVTGVTLVDFEENDHPLLRHGIGITYPW